MAYRKGKQTVVFDNPKTVSCWASVGSKKEREGPLGKNFDYIDVDSTFGQKSWEKGETAMIARALQELLNKANLRPWEIGCIFAGDLINQCTSTTFGIRDFEIPLYGVYGACSTMAETIALGAITLESGAYDRVIAVTASHFCTAERQFRFPLEYGSVKTPTAQWTATAAGAVILENMGTAPYIRAVTTGVIKDCGVCDQSNMGAAMAPSAAETLLAFFSDTGMVPLDFDLIVTGDLGVCGGALLKKLMLGEGVDIEKQYTDCGVLIYDNKRQNTPSGASGCGCSAGVLTSSLLDPIKKGKLRNVLFVATGALMSPLTVMQKESIPSIAHLIWFSHDKR